MANSAGKGGPDMAAEFTNIAKDQATVGIQASVVHGPVTVRQQTPVAPVDAKALLDQIADLRRAIAEAQHRHELTAEEGAAAEAELDVARTEVAAAVEGHREGLVASLRRLAMPLAGAIDLLSKLAQIIKVVQGLR